MQIGDCQLLSLCLDRLVLLSRKQLMTKKYAACAWSLLIFWLPNRHHPLWHKTGSHCPVISPAELPVEVSTHSQGTAFQFTFV